MVRGIAQPLCAMYTASYLARNGYNVDPEAKDYLLILIDFSFKIVDKAMNEGIPNLSNEDYLSLFEPPVDWIFQTAGYGGSKKLFFEVF